MTNNRSIQASATYGLNGSELNNNYRVDLIDIVRLQTCLDLVANDCGVGDKLNKVLNSDSESFKLQQLGRLGFSYKVSSDIVNHNLRVTASDLQESMPEDLESEVSIETIDFSAKPTLVIKGVFNSYVINIETVDNLISSFNIIPITKIDKITDIEENLCLGHFEYNCDLKGTEYFMANVITMLLAYYGEVKFLFEEHELKTISEWLDRRLSH